MFDFPLKKTATNIEEFIRSVMKNEHYQNIVIGISGGIDSATSLSLVVRALGKENVYPVLMPYGTMHDDATKDAWLVIDSLSIPHERVTIINIKPFVDKFCEHDTSIEAMRLGNSMARARMMVLFDLVKKYSALVVGTENKSEHLLGYYTRFGDEASDIEPLRKLYKTQVFMLAKYLCIPEKILKKAPTAGLWEGQSDEGEFGFSYKTADEVLWLHTEEKLSKLETIKRGYQKETVEKIWWWVEKGEFKERLPHIFK